MDKNPWLEQFIPTRLDWLVIKTNSVLSVIFSNRKDFDIISVKSDNDVGIDCHIFHEAGLEENIKQRITKTIENMINAIAKDHGWAYDKLKTNIIFQNYQDEENKDSP